MLRSPPAAVWRVTADWRWQAVHGLLFAVATAAVLIWVGQQLQVRWPHLELRTGAAASLPDASWAFLAWGTVLSAAATAWGWRLGRQPLGHLLWTGSRWRWQADTSAAAAGDVSITAMLDGDGWLLLRLRAAQQPQCGWAFWRQGQITDPPRWLYICGPQGQQVGQRAQWAAFRAAVYSAAAPCNGPALPNSLLH